MPITMGKNSKWGKLDFSYYLPMRTLYNMMKNGEHGVDLTNGGDIWCRPNWGSLCTGVSNILTSWIKAMDEGSPKKNISIRTLNHFAVWNLPIQGLSSGNFRYVLPDLMLLQGPATTSLFNIALMGKIGKKCIFLCFISYTEKSVHHFGTKN